MKSKDVKIVSDEEKFVGKGMEKIVDREYGEEIEERRGGIVDKVDEKSIVIREKEEIDK